MLELNQIYNMDCVRGMKELETESIKLTVTSPPYDNLRTYKGYAWDFEATAKELYRVTMTGGVVVWVVSDETVNGSETGTSYKQALYFKSIGFNIHDSMIWHKGSNPFQHSNRYINCYEFMFVFSKGSPITTNLICDRKNKWSGTQIHGTERQRDGETKNLSALQKSKEVKEYGSRLNVWEIAPVKYNETGHPAPFPERLVKDHIKTWSNELETVLDPFMGSGTTAKAAYDLDRNYIGFEISEEYCLLANSRMDKHKRQIRFELG